MLVVGFGIGLVVGWVVPALNVELSSDQKEQAAAAGELQTRIIKELQ
ncbi:MAG: hypothetical protein FJ000_06415, partial [Actinobacteria bacterium]|nr:hypothetical protein [Actinomycetota bacterium]